jgi:hypothetical protein
MPLWREASRRCRCLALRDRRGDPPIAVPEMDRGAETDPGRMSPQALYRYGRTGAI